MKTSNLNTAKTRDIFDRLSEESSDIFDRVELDPEEKAAYSDVMKETIREEMKNLPIGKMISEMVSRFANEQKESTTYLKGLIEKSIKDLRSDLKRDENLFREKLDEEIGKLKNKYDHMRSEMMGPRYTFGGFSPQTNDLVIGPPAVEGAWRMVKSGNDLVFERYESGVWTLKGSFTP